MALTSNQSYISVQGRSDNGPYYITIPFFHETDLKVKCRLAGQSALSDLDPGDYSIVKEGNAYALYTRTPLGSNSQLTISRVIEYTQPASFPLSGPFPSRAVETALDRVTMQIQQVAAAAAKVEGSAPIDLGEGGTGNLTWANKAERDATKPKQAGQLGTQRDNQTVWIARSSTPGDWLEYRPKRTKKLVFGYTADAGNYLNRPAQDKIAALFTDWACDAVLFAGGGNYNGTGLTEGTIVILDPDNPDDDGVDGQEDKDTKDWEPFASWIDDHRVFPALGDVDTEDESPEHPEHGWRQRHAARFSYLNNEHGRRYYKETFGDGLVDLFVLHSGLNASGIPQEDDGVDAESAQHDWFEAAVDASSARWKIAMFHAPPVSLNGDPGIVCTEIAWDKLKEMDLILCGKAHLFELLRWKETMIANFSASLSNSGFSDKEVNGSESSTDRALWADSEQVGCGRIVATMERLEIEAWSSKGYVIHARNVEDFRTPPLGREVLRVGATTAPVTTMVNAYLTTMSTPGMIRRVAVSLNGAGSALPWALKADGVPITKGTIAANTTYQTVDVPSPDSTDPAFLTEDRVFPAGTRLTLTVTAASGPPTGLIVTISYHHFAGDTGFWNTIPSGISTLTDTNSPHQTYQLTVTNGVLQLQAI